VKGEQSTFQPFAKARIQIGAGAHFGKELVEGVAAFGGPARLRQAALLSSKKGTTS